MGRFKLQNVRRIRRIFNLSPDIAFLGDFFCYLKETELFLGYIYPFENCMCFYGESVSPRTEYFKIIIPYKDVTCAKKADAEHPSESIDITVGRKLYRFQLVDDRDVLLDTIQNGRSKCLHSQQSSKDAVPGDHTNVVSTSAEIQISKDAVSEEQQEFVLDKKTSASQERPDNCTLSFPIIADRSMIKRRHLVLEKSLCTRLMWGKVQPKPEFTVHGFDLLGNPKRWTIQSEQTDFRCRWQIKFSRGWDDFMVDNQIEENDIITLKKKYSNEAAFSAHLYRWDKSTHSYKKKNSCAQCGKEEKEEVEEENQLP